MIAVISLIIILLAVPVTLFESQQVQDPRQEAATAEITSIGTSLDEPCPVPPSNNNDDVYIPPNDNTDDVYTPPNDNRNPDNSNDEVYNPPSDNDTPDDPSEEPDSSDNPFTRLRDRILERFNNNRKPNSPQFPDGFPFNRDNTNTKKPVKTPPNDLGNQIRNKIKESQGGQQDLGSKIRSNIKNAQGNRTSPRNAQTPKQDLGQEIRSKIPTPRSTSRNTVPNTATRPDPKQTVADRLREAGVQNTGSALSEPCEPTPEWVNPNDKYRDPDYEYPTSVPTRDPYRDSDYRDPISRYTPAPSGTGSKENQQNPPPSGPYEPNQQNPGEPNDGSYTVSILNYNSIIDCYSDTTSPRSCTAAKKAQADLNNDGLVNQIDYNIFIVQLRQSTQ